jgi:predicted AAA+ superfamily ATPase
MDKDTIKVLISEYQNKVVDIALTERHFCLEDALNYVFVGLRRVGKSYLMFQQIRHLLQGGHKNDEILYFNFEDERISSLDVTDLDLIKLCYEEMFSCKPIFFLDEIQVVDHWEKFARRLSDQGYRVYITGSNAKMLSSEIATTLGGRYMIQNVYPFSFNEHLLSQGIDCTAKNTIYQFRVEILKAFEVYFRFGGLPELIQVNDKRSWLSSLYQKVFFGDLIARHQIRNDFALRALIRKLAESVKQASSFNRLANVVSSCGKKISTDTVIDYLGYLKDAWLIFSIENYSAKIAEKESNKKYYFIDNGLINLFLIDPLTSLLENQVAIQLRRLYGDNVYFYQHNVEVDFYIPQMQLAVQVCYSVADSETRLREIKALIKLSERIDVREMLIVTKDEEEDITMNEKTIKVIPVWKWLLTAN